MNKEELRQNWRVAIEHSGGHCPVCDRWGKINVRSINRTMARSLIWLCNTKKDEGGWVEVPRKGPSYVTTTNQLPSLRWWGLIERKPNDDPAKKHSGIWRPTKLGFDFMNGKVKVAKKVYVYNKEVEMISQDKVDIYDCFKDVFDYREIMNNFVPKGKK
jgi:hypothetical protein